MAAALRSGSAAMETGGETSPPPPPSPPSEGTTTITRSDPLTPSDSFEEDQPVNTLSEDLRGKIVRQVILNRYTNLL